MLDSLPPLIQAPILTLVYEMETLSAMHIELNGYADSPEVTKIHTQYESIYSIVKHAYLHFDSSSLHFLT